MAGPAELVVCYVLNAVYEADFLGFSYGFRPGRNPHQALDVLVESAAWDGGADGAGVLDAVALAHGEPALRSFVTGLRADQQRGQVRFGGQPRS
jgi:hypothetical protein